MLPSFAQPVGLRYETRTGALLRVDGAIAGAFDREHDTIVVAASSHERKLTLEVELASLPTHGLPNGPGARWTLMQRRKAERPRDRIDIVDAPELGVTAAPEDPLPLIAHAHLDLAWLWTFAEGRRKGLRTLANALYIAERAPDYVFIQSQPALYAYVEHDDPEFFKRIAEAVRKGQIDPSVAAPWVETDCNIPSGETLLRQLVHGMNYVQERFGIVPSIVWLPDTFGFPNTLPQLLMHAGVRFFATAKLQWNETTPWPHPQFVWIGPDRSAVVAAVIDGYEGGATPERVAKARERHEALVVGYGDGGGGPNDAIVREAERYGRWTSARTWFESFAMRADQLPRVDGELYLETHRGVWTTHHDVKAHRFALEGALDEAEELAAWCIAVRASSNLTAPLSADVRSAWPPLLRGDFHDVVCGTSIGPVYGELEKDYERVGRVCARVREAAYSLLPRGQINTATDEIAPREDDDAYVFENAHLYARVRRDGTVVALHGPGQPNLVTGANVLRAYVDRPKEWEAWNIDASYVRRPVRIRPGGSDIEDGALVVRYRVRGSTIVVRLSLGSNDPYLRVDAAVLWDEVRTLLRVENWLPVHAQHATFGTPHGTVDRTTSMQTDSERAKFEVPGQRFGRVDGPDGGFALLATDNYGWNAKALARGGTHLGLSLLRSPLWPDADADRGEHRLSWALAPLVPGSGIGALENAWRAYAYPTRVRLFTCEDPAVLIVACKPADDDGGIIVRVRECDGATRRMRLQVGGRARSVESCDARERSIEREAAVEDGAIVAGLEPYELRTFRVRL
ncbi:MAG: glycoside hydrolase family 38 C-terminal domain-containing protein [Vulcanimicrobiaceae bacterium]